VADELEQLDAWRAGDEAAGSALLSAQFDRLYRFFGSKAPAEDVGELIQRTLLLCVEHRDRFEGRSAFGTYVYAIARSVLVAFYRERARHPIEPDAVSVADLDPSPPSLIGRRQQSQLLLTALRRLPIDHQTLLELCYWESLTGPELAAVFEVPEGTIRTRLRRARQLLEQEIEAVASSPVLARETLDDLEGWALEVRREIDARRGGPRPG
jgi:RNA polymerase sigma factor (sigma-70 family)